MAYFFGRRYGAPFFISGATRAQLAKHASSRGVAHFCGTTEKEPPPRAPNPFGALVLCNLSCRLKMFQLRVLSPFFRSSPHTRPPLGRGRRPSQSRSRDPRCPSVFGGAFSKKCFPFLLSKNIRLPTMPPKQMSTSLLFLFCTLSRRRLPPRSHPFCASL